MQDPEPGEGLEDTGGVDEFNPAADSVHHDAQRRGVTVKSLHDWISKYGSNSSQHQALTSQQEEIRKLKAELRRVTEERNILKEAAAYFAGETKRNTRS